MNALAVDLGCQCEFCHKLQTDEYSAETSTFTNIALKKITLHLKTDVVGLFALSVHQYLYVQNFDAKSAYCEWKKTTTLK